MTVIAKITTPWHRELIFKNNATGDYFLEVIHTGGGGMINTYLTKEHLTELRDALNTILDPQLYYLRLVEGDPHSFINLVTADSRIRLDDKREWCGHQTRFTAEEIESNPALKRLEAFKVPVEEVDA